MKRIRTVSRRSLLQASLLAGSAPLFVKNLLSAPPSGRVRHASFGAAGMAGSDLGSITKHSAIDLVCVADVDSSRLDALQKRFPDKKIKVYQDWRVLLDKEGSALDSANVSTPDHMHAPIAMSAMQRGINVYVQKPLAHSLYETRKLTEFARAKKLVTQMGIQIHSLGHYRLGVALAQCGTIGKIKEVHLWSDRRWGDANPIPDKSDPVPATLAWDLWLGVAPSRPYLNGFYHPGNWRKRVDFGTGSLGDMGCHIFDPVYEGLGLTAPLSVRSDGPPAEHGNWALDEVLRYEFPGTKFTAGPTVKFTWYDGAARPPKEILDLLGDQKFPSNGSIWAGTDGTMLLPHVGAPVLLPKGQYKDYKLPDAPGSDHYAQFVDAVLGKGTPSAAFDYSGPLTETVLLGALATLFPQKTLQWDSAALKVKNLPEADRYIRGKYRPGWEVKGLS